MAAEEDPMKINVPQIEQLVLHCILYIKNYEWEIRRNMRLSIFGIILINLLYCARHLPTCIESRNSFGLSAGSHLPESCLKQLQPICTNCSA